MMHMMSTPGFHNGIATLFAAHALGMIVFSVGLVFLIVWAIKTLTPAKLWAWGLGLTIGGAVLCVLSLAATPRYNVVSYKAGNMMPSQGSNVQFMMKTTDGDMGMMGHSMGNMMMEGDAMNMSMNDMSAMLKGKTGDDFDEAFIEGMIPHHQGAIDMAEEAMKSAKHAELREMATGIISAQQEEIDMMNQWLKDWGYTK